MGRCSTFEKKDADAKYLPKLLKSNHNKYLAEKIINTNLDKSLKLKNIKEFLKRPRKHPERKK